MGVAAALLRLRHRDRRGVSRPKGQATNKHKYVGRLGRVLTGRLRSRVPILLSRWPDQNQTWEAAAPGKCLRVVAVSLVGTKRRERTWAAGGTSAYGPAGKGGMEGRPQGMGRVATRRVCPGLLTFPQACSARPRETPVLATRSRWPFETAASTWCCGPRSASPSGRVLGLVWTSAAGGARRIARPAPSVAPGVDSIRPRRPPDGALQVSSASTARGLVRGTFKAPGSTAGETLHRGPWSGSAAAAGVHTAFRPRQNRNPSRPSWPTPPKLFAIWRLACPTTPRSCGRSTPPGGPRRDARTERSVARIDRRTRPGGWHCR